MVQGNLPQLQQVVLNLMLNAAEAMAELPPAERRIDVETGVREDGFRELAVADRGRGLSPEMATDAFKPFVSTSRTASASVSRSAGRSPRRTGHAGLRRARARAPASC